MIRPELIPSSRSAVFIPASRPSMAIEKGRPRSVCVCGSKKISAWTPPSACSRRK